MNGYKRILFLVLIMGAVAAIATAAALTILYNTAFEEERARLVVTVKSQARLMEAIVRYEIGETENPDIARNRTLSQIREAHLNYEGFGETGELTLAMRQGDEIVYILEHKNIYVGEPKPVPFNSKLAVPMRRALSGRSGTVVGLDYRGVRVLAAYEPVAVLDLGAVAKIDLAEIRAPFIRASIIVAVIAVLIVAVGTGFFFLVSDPIIKRLRESEERFRLAFDESAVPMALTEPDSSRFYRVNPALCRWLGYTQEEMAEKTIFDITHPGDRARHDELRRKLIEQGTGHFRLEKRYIRKDGGILWGDLDISLLCDDQGKVLYAYGQIRDITEQKKAEEALRESRERLQGAIESLQEGFVLFDADDRMVTINDVYRQINPRADEFLEKRQRFEDLVRVNAERGRLVEAIGREEEFIRERMEQHRNPGAPIIRQFGDGSWYVIKETRTPEGGTAVTFTDVTEQKKAEHALKEREQRFRAVTETANDAIISIDQEGKVILWNEAAEKFFGYSEPEILGKPVAKIIPKRFRKKYRDGLKRLNKTGVSGLLGRTTELVGLRKDGGEFPVELSLSMWKTDGTVNYVGVVRDATERKQAEAALRRSEERLSGAVMSLQEGFVLFDADDRLIMMNDVYRRMGPAAEDFLELGMSFEDLIRAYVERGLIVEAIGREEEFIRERMEKHRNPKGPIIRQFGDGTWYMLKETRTPEGGTALTFTDITGLKQFEAALRESQERFKDIAESTSDWIWEMGPDLRFTYFSDRYQEITHFDPKDRLGTTRIDFVPESELRANAEKWAAHLADLEARRPFKDLEYASMATAEGIRYIRVSGKPVFDAEGNFLGYRGTGTNITEQKRAEEELRKLSSAVEQSPAAILITDVNGTIEYVNPKFTEITGYSAEEAIGRTPRMLKSDETPAAVYERLWAAITSGEEWRGTLRKKRKDGTVYLAGVSISPITAPDGAVTHFVWAQQDITQRVEGERRLKQAEKMESLGSLAGGIAHDFNNMLLPILSLTDMTRKSLPEDSRDRLRLEKVVEAATRAKDLVARILAFSRKEDAKRENIDIHAAIHETMGLLRSTLPTTIKIKQRLKRDTGTVFADRAQMASVLLNLASNAADAMNGKTGEMRLSLSPLEVDRKKAASIPGLHEGKYAKLAVKDNGHGMDEETLARIMDPFFTTKPVGEGTGLGLSMIHGIVSKHGGAVDISSTPGKGTTVEVYLPLAEGEAVH